MKFCVHRLNNRVVKLQAAAISYKKRKKDVYSSSCNLRGTERHLPYGII